MASLSERYGAALYVLLSESGQFEGALQQVILVRDALDNDECRRLLENPRITREEKRLFLSNAFHGQLHKHINGFFRLLITKNRESIILPALTACIELAGQNKSRVEVHVVSATTLDTPQIDKLSALLTKKIGRPVDISLQIDPSLLGGLCIHAEGFYLDYTVKKRLHELKSSLF